MVVRAVVIVALVVSGCRNDEPLEKLAPSGMRTFEPTSRPAPPPPPPPEAKAGPAPEPIGAFVRDRFGAPSVTLSFEQRSVELSASQARRLVERLAAHDAFFDGMNGCACGAVGVRIARAAEHVDFVVNCGNVYVGERHVGVLAGDIIEYIDALL